MIIKNIKLSTCFVKLLTFFSYGRGYMTYLYILCIFCAAVMEIFSNK